MGVCEGVLGRQVLTMDQAELKRRLRLAGCEDTERIPWQLQVQAFIGKGPRQGPQLLHRDGEYAMVQLPGEQIEHEISCIWATHDFTNNLGATRVVVGSHRWPRQRQPSAKESVGAEMPKGSVVMYAGHTLHGAGANTTDDWVSTSFILVSAVVVRSCSNSDQ
jgi:ectoine hydroxylase-related dioxygenase (phytanoyl-CoA dioxygenase family)